jgi:hypothetical protein
MGADTSASGRGGYEDHEADKGVNTAADAGSESAEEGEAAMAAAEDATVDPDDQQS